MAVQTLSNDVGFLEAFYKAINSLPTNMLTSIMSTELTKWVIRISHFYILGGILMVKNVRNAIVKGKHLKMRCQPQGNTKDVLAWV